MENMTSDLLQWTLSLFFLIMTPMDFFCENNIISRKSHPKVYQAAFNMLSLQPPMTRFSQNDQMSCVLWDVIAAAASGQQDTNQSLLVHPPFTDNRCIQLQAYVCTHQSSLGTVYSHSSSYPQHFQSNAFCTSQKILLNNNFTWRGTLPDLIQVCNLFYNTQKDQIDREHKKEELQHTKKMPRNQISKEALFEKVTQYSYMYGHSKQMHERRLSESQPVCYYSKIRDELGLDAVVRGGDTVAIVKLVVGNMSGFVTKDTTTTKNGKAKRRDRRQKRTNNKKKKNKQTKRTYQDLTYKNQLAVVSKYKCKKGDGLVSITINSPGSGSPMGLLTGLSRLRTQVKGFSNFKVVKPLTLSNVCTISQSFLGLFHGTQQQPLQQFDQESVTTRRQEDTGGVSMAMVQFPGKEKYTPSAKSIDFTTNTNMYGKLKGRVLQQALIERDTQMKKNPACDHILMKWKADVDEYRAEMSERSVNSILATSRALGSSPDIVKFLTKKCSLNRLCVATSGRLSRARYDWRNKAAMRAFKAENSKKTRHLLIQCPQINMLLDQMPDGPQKKELQQSLARISRQHQTGQLSIQ